MINTVLCNFIISSNSSIIRIIRNIMKKPIKVLESGFVLLLILIGTLRLSGKEGEISVRDFGAIPGDSKDDWLTFNFSKTTLLLKLQNRKGLRKLFLKPVSMSSKVYLVGKE